MTPPKVDITPKKSTAGKYWCKSLAINSAEISCWYLVNGLQLTHIYIYYTYEYRTKLGMTKVVLRGSWGCHHCKTDRGPP